MNNQKNGRRWSKFSTPAIIAAFSLSLQFVVEFPVALFLYMTQLVNDIVISRLIVLVISQVICTTIFIFLIIPFLRVKDVEYRSFGYGSFFQFIIVFCLFWATLIPVSIGFSIIFNYLRIEVDIFKNVLYLSKNHYNNLVSVIIWLIAGVLGLAIFLEYLYRRTLIPLLEKRGMSPFSAVLTSSIAFALISIPVNLGFQITFLRESTLLNFYLSRYDLITSLFHALSHFVIVFLLGLACGIVYILTRNVLFSIMVHCFGLLPFYILELFTNNIFVISLVTLLIIVMNISGLFIALYALYLSFTPSSQAEWITILKRKSLVNINRGLVGFFMVFLGIVINIVLFFGLLAENAPIMVTLLFNIVFLGFCFKNLREDLMRNQPGNDHPIKEIADVS